MSVQHRAVPLELARLEDRVEELARLAEARGVVLPDDAAVHAAELDHLGQVAVRVERGFVVEQAARRPRVVEHKDGRAEDADRKSTRLNSSHSGESRMPSSA